MVVRQIRECVELTSHEDVECLVYVAGLGKAGAATVSRKVNNGQWLL